MVDGSLRVEGLFRPHDEDDGNEEDEGKQEGTNKFGSLVEGGKAAGLRPGCHFFFANNNHEKDIIDNIFSYINFYLIEGWGTQ